MPKIYELTNDEYARARHVVRNALYTNMPSEIDANVCRHVADKILEALKDMELAPKP